MTNRPKPSPIPLEGDLVHSPAGEQYSAVVDRILENVSRGAILVTSCSHAEGRTTTSANLALAFHARRISVLLAELPSKRLALEKLFGAAPARLGIETVLSGRRELADVLCRRNDNGLMLAMVHDAPPHEEIRPGSALNALVNAAREDFDWSVFDGPSVSESERLAEIASAFNVVVLTVKKRLTSPADLRSAIKLLSHPLTLVVLNS